MTKAVKPCPSCQGTGYDAAKTAERRKSYTTGVVRCWTCQGSGVDEAHYFYTLLENQHARNNT